MGDLLVAVIAIVLSGAGLPAAPTAGPQVTAPESEPEIGVPAAPSDKRALVVGDSLAEGVEPHLGDFLPGWRIATSAYTGRPTADGVSEIVGRGSLPPVLIVSLGTNDDPSAVSSFQGSVEAVLRAAGPGSCVVWPNIVRPPYNGVSYAGYNKALARLSYLQPNLIVVDWAGMAAQNPGLISPDGVHATPTGYAARARAIASAVLGCTGQTGYGAGSARIPGE